MQQNLFLEIHRYLFANGQLSAKYRRPDLIKSRVNIMGVSRRTYVIRDHAVLEVS